MYSALENGRAVALKIVDLELPWELEEAEKEVRILCSLKHAHVARILRVFVHGKLQISLILIITLE